MLFCERRTESMRTRFLNVDFFSQALNFSFLRLPLPCVAPPSLCDQFEFLCLDSISSVSFDIDGFNIEDVLSRFLSDVLPHHIDVPYPLRSSINRSDYNDGEVDNEKFNCGFTEIRHGENGCSCVDYGLEEDKRTISRSELQKIEVTHKEVELLCQDNNVDTHKSFGSLTLELEIGKKSMTMEKDGEGFRVFQFETPETLNFSEQSFVPEKVDEEIFSEVTEIDIPLDINHDIVVEAIPCLSTLSESVYSVHDIALEHRMEKRISYCMEDTTSVSDRSSLHPISYPLLEVNELNLEFYKCSATEEELYLLLEDIGIQQSTQKHNLVVDGKDLLGSADINILECLSEHSPSKQSFEQELQSLNSIIEMEFIGAKEATYFKGSSVDYPEVPDDDLYTLTSPVHFQEVQILDLDYSQPFGATLGSQTAQDPETCDQIFGENSHSISNFYKSFVSHELVLVNDSFISLPIPLLLNEIDIWSPSTIFEEILTGLKPHPPSASDVIYLDWHLLREDRCTQDICCTCRNRLEEIDTYGTDTELKCDTDALIANEIIFCNEILDVSNMLERKEIINELIVDAASDNLFKEKVPNPRIRKPTLETNAGTAADLFKSMSEFSDLNFFLNPGKATMRRNVEPAAVKAITNVETKLPLVSSSNTIGTCDSIEMKLLKWQIEVQEVRLSDNILSLINNLQNCYLAIMEDDNDLQRRLCSFPFANDFPLLSVPKQKLMDWIKESYGGKNNSFSHKDETFVALVALYVIKQMASYLCFYGINTTYLYTEYISKSFKWLGQKLSFLQSLIEDAHLKTENDISKSHPSLSAFKDILDSSFSQSDSKVLLVAEKLFWSALKRLLTAMGLSFVGLKDSDPYSNKKDAWNSEELINCTLDSLLNTNCFLISHEHVSASFPFNKFSCILEYGGSRGLSTISTISPKLAGLPRVHFLKVELEEFNVLKAFCEAVNVFKDAGPSQEEIFESTCTLHKINLQKFEDSLNFTPLGEKCICVESLEPVDNAKCCSVPISVPSMQFARFEQRKSIPPSLLDIVVIANTQNLFKEMLISRRSSYQKILAIEKGRAQVVEREINLPVDLILGAEMCLLWYNCKNIWKKETVGPDASLCMPTCVENIATNILTSLSFAFSSCILIFEGERDFLGAVMESSDELYAAAASLGLDLQLFCSYSSELTDRIILSSIDNVSMLNGGLYQKMSESETLAESFLTSFPSINSLSAHAILSSGGMLVEFLEWSHNNRIRAIRRYHVPDESVALFSALCRYGEQEESKSGMTECSSVSSAPDSGNSSPRIESQKKRQKHIISIDEPLEEDFMGGPLNQPREGNLHPSRLSQPYQSWILTRSHDVSNEVKMPDLSLNNSLFCQPEGLDFSDFSVNNLDLSGTDKTRNPSKSGGKVIGLGESFLCEDYSIEKNGSFSMRKPDMGNDLKLANSSSARSFLYGLNDHPGFLTPGVIKSNSDIWYSMKNHNGDLEEDICDHAEINVNEDMLPLETRRKSLEKAVEKSTRKANRLVLPQNAMSPYGGTPLSKAIHSSRLPQGSPWTIEFLNKIKEKRKIRQKSLLCNTSASCLGYHDSMERISKRKSPSTINCYRYQGASNSQKVIKQKYEIQSAKTLRSSKNVKPSTALLPSWTPVDKKAKQTLTFARNGNETQSKLVWSEGFSGLKGKMM